MLPRSNLELFTPQGEGKWCDDVEYVVPFTGSETSPNEFQRVGSS